MWDAKAHETAMAKHHFKNTSMSKQSDNATRNKIEEGTPLETMKRGGKDKCEPRKPDKHKRSFAHK